MNTQKVAVEFRMSQWAQIIQTRLDNRQTIIEFCKASGISKNAYFYWQKKLREKACTEFKKIEAPKDIVPDGWLQLNPKNVQQTQKALNIEVNGCHIAVNSETDTELLKNICRTLRSL